MTRRAACIDVYSCGLLVRLSDEASIVRPMIDMCQQDGRWLDGI